MTDWERLFDDNRSVWLADQKEYESAPPLARDLDADVAIIGGGFTGVSTAYHLSQRFPDRRIVLLEARTLANGASGRNGGQMLAWVHGFETRDPEQMRRIYDATREGIEGIVSIIDRHRLDVPYRRDGHLDVYTDPRNADEAAGEIEKLSSAGVPVRYLGRSELRDYVDLQGVEGAVLDPAGGQLHGLAFVRSLRPVLEERGVVIHENTPVMRVRENRTIEITTPSATVRASSIVLATNAYTPHLGYFRSGLVPLHSHVVGTEPLPADRWVEIGWKKASGFTDDRDRLSYATRLASGRLLFGGGDNAAYDYLYGNGTRYPGASVEGSRACHRGLLEYLPGTKDVAITHRWSGPVALTLDRVCTMGVMGENRNVFFALGYSGHGVTLANLAGQVLCDTYAGAGEKWRGLPFYQRKLRFIPGEPLRSVGYHVYTRLTGRSPRAVG